MKTIKNLTLEQGSKLFIEQKTPLCEIIRYSNLKEDIFVSYLHELGYKYAGYGKRNNTVINLKLATDEFLNSNEILTLTYVSKKYHIAPKLIKEYLAQFYPDFNLKGLPKFNEYIFDTIDTEEKAYWLGFIFADGTISSSPLREKAKTQYQFELSLSSKDLEHLEKFKKFISFTQNIYCDDTRCRISVYSKHFWNVLNCNGCTPQKSLNLKFPKKELFSSSELIIHFIRGYFDGDGCLTYHDKNHTICEISVLGTSEFLNNIQSIIGTNKLLIINHPEEQSITKYFSITGKEAFFITKLLYGNATIYLDRKYEKFKEYCRLYQE